MLTILFLTAVLSACITPWLVLIKCNGISNRLDVIAAELDLIKIELRSWEYENGDDGGGGDDDPGSPIDKPEETETVVTMARAA